jgi:hypothetical protein
MVERFKDKLKDHIKDIGSAMELAEKEQRKRVEAERVGNRPVDYTVASDARKKAANAQADEIIKQRKKELEDIERERQHELWDSNEDAGIEEDKVKEAKKVDAVLKKELGEKKEELEVDQLELRARKEKAYMDLRKTSDDIKARMAAEKAAQHASKSTGLMTNLAVKTTTAMHGDTPKSIINLFWLAVFIHAIIIVLSFLHMDESTLLLVSIILYLLLLIRAIFAFKKEGELDSSTIGWLIGLSIFCIVLPTILSIFVPDVPFVGTTTWLDWALFFRLLIPAWPFYLGIVKFDIPAARWWIGLIMLALLVFFILNYGLKINTSQLIALGMRPTDISRSTAVFKYIADEGKAMITNFAKKLGSPTTWLNKTESYFGLNYYTSTIDGTEEEPVGFYITGVKSEDKYFYEGSPATVVADIRGKSFVDELFVIPSCYIDKKGDGVATPESFHILGEEQSSFYCRFTDLTKGSYTAKVSATFDFETWAYLEYNFVDLEVKRSFDAKHESVNTALNIPTTTKSISTPGPVNLGMASSGLTQPILIDRAYNTRKPAIGASVLNQWTDGQIGEVYQFVLMVPDDFSLVDCTRGVPTTQTNENITGYTDYTFTKEQLDPRLTFEQVRCFLQLKDPAGFFAGGAQKVKRTFIGKVKYRYKLEKSVSLIVKP